jgi:hypothetical protein
VTNKAVFFKLDFEFLFLPTSAARADRLSILVCFQFNYRAGFLTYLL